MNIAACGDPRIALRLKNSLKNIDVNIEYFVNELYRTNAEPAFKPLSFFEFRRKIESRELDGLIITTIPDHGLIRMLKLYRVPKVGLINLQYPRPIQWLDPSKEYIHYIETNIIDRCNLNCKGCTHFAALFGNDDFYSLDAFKRDMRKLSEDVDIFCFRLLGGEPLLKKDLVEYIETARNYFPQTDIRLVTNGLLLPSAPPELFQAIRRNDIFLDITAYPPTVKMFDNITDTLSRNGIKFGITPPVETFKVFMCLSGGHDPRKARAICINDTCRFIRDGKIYKCPVDGLAHRYAEAFGIEKLPSETGVDLFAKNFLSMLRLLDDNIERCGWCNETARDIPWQAGVKPQAEDWLA